MADQTSETGVPLWGGLRQLQAMRDSMMWALAGHTVGDTTKAGVLKWLREQGLGDVEPTRGTPPGGVDSPGPDFTILATLASGIDNHRQRLLGPDFLTATLRGRRGAQSSDDYGSERSGAGWQGAANFCITSAFIRILGAWEQYELDVLKALVHYRPSGEKIGPNAEQLVIEPDLAVVREEPTRDKSDPNKLVSVRTPSWSEIHKDVQNNVKRAMFFSRTYGINATPGRGAEKKQNNERRRNWYDKRNKIAHGREDVVMPISEYVEVEVFVYRSMLHVATQCREQHNLLV